jgi:hypothetical protein
MQQGRERTEERLDSKRSAPFSPAPPMANAITSPSLSMRSVEA